MRRKSSKNKHASQISAEYVACCAAVSGPTQQIDGATAAQTERFSFGVTWSAMLSTPISQTQPGRSSFIRIQLRGELRRAAVSASQTTPITKKAKRGMRSLPITVVVYFQCLLSDDAGLGVLVRLQAWRSAPVSAREMATPCGRKWYCTLFTLYKASCGQKSRGL